jgi:hypothetical protein
VANNNYPQITSVTSEALQAQVRNLLPSQEGFGTDLMAQNVIVPVIDLTRAAEGSTVPQILQTAIAFGSQTSFNLTASGTISTTTGFLRIIGTAQATNDTNVASAKIAMTDGLSTKTIWGIETAIRNSGSMSAVDFDFVIFAAAGISVTGQIANKATIIGSVRQIADINGNLVNPSGFTPQ